MDFSLIRTFLEVSAAGSFGIAGERLFISQSAVSLRIQRLEDEIGRPLFTRSKAGTDLTPAGREFERYALSLTKIWEEARQQVAIPESFRASLSIGAQYSLWPRLGFRLVDGLRITMPDLALRTELGMPDRLTRLLVEGMLQVAIMYTPTLRPGLTARLLMKEKLVLVASWENPKREDLPGRYVFVDWGPEFVQAHALHLPELTDQGLTFSLGALTAEFISRRSYAGYLPERYVRRYCESGLLHLVPEVPSFPYPVWSVWREDLDPEIAAQAERVLAEVVSRMDLETGASLDALRQLIAPSD
ncbi:MAG: LysR family transcriptional regulator [Paracoccaceae bacterium]